MWEEAQGVHIEEATLVVLNDGYSFIGTVNDPMTARHRGRGNGAFWDGHVQFLDADRFNNDVLYIRALLYGGLIPPP